MAATFLAEGKLPQRLGFDTRANPPWTMVPLNGERQVTLAGGPDLTVALKQGADPKACVVTELQPSAGGRVFQLRGGVAKTVVLEARDKSGALKASLEISVKAKKTLWTYFGFVFDKSGRVTSRGYAEAMQIIETANKIITPQTNVEMKRDDSGAVKLDVDIASGFPVDLGEFLAPATWARPDIAMLPCISSKPIGADGRCQIETAAVAPMSQKHFTALREYQIVQNVVATVKPQFGYNIFFVRTFKTSASGLNAGTGAFTPTDYRGKAIEVCFMPDLAAGQELAHELGHYLLRDIKLPGVGNHSLSKLDLMCDAPNVDSLWVPRDQANVMNKSGKP